MDKIAISYMLLIARFQNKDSMCSINVKENKLNLSLAAWSASGQVNLAQQPLITLAPRINASEISLWAGQVDDPDLDANAEYQIHKSPSSWTAASP